jgi:hypothetical protein
MRAGDTSCRHFLEEWLTKGMKVQGQREQLLHQG